jgi:hypothetical protein
MRAGVTATVAADDVDHEDTAANVPASSRFRHNQKPPSSHTNAFSLRRSRLKKMKQSPA